MLCLTKYLTALFGRAGMLVRLATLLEQYSSRKITGCQKRTLYELTMALQFRMCNRYN